MPLAGGRPQRRTFNNGAVTFVGWTPDNKLLVSTDAYSTLPNNQLIILDLADKKTPIPVKHACR